MSKTQPTQLPIIKITKMPLKCKWPKYSKIFKNDQNTPKLENYQNNPKTYKMTKIPPKPKNDQNNPKTLKKDQNTPETQKRPKYP